MAHEDAREILGAVVGGSGAGAGRFAPGHTSKITARRKKLKAIT
jgi:hypothetical protein